MTWMKVRLLAFAPLLGLLLTACHK